jgi:hypothetical protein
MRRKDSSGTETPVGGHAGSDAGRGDVVRKAAATAATVTSHHHSVAKRRERPASKCEYNFTSHNIIGASVRGTVSTKRPGPGKLNFAADAKLSPDDFAHAASCPVQTDPSRTHLFQIISAANSSTILHRSSRCRSLRPPPDDGMTCSDSHLGRLTLSFDESCPSRSQ